MIGISHIGRGTESISIPALLSPSKIDDGVRNDLPTPRPPLVWRELVHRPFFLWSSGGSVPLLSVWTVSVHRHVIACPKDLA